jgi:hypothetical protein
MNTKQVFITSLVSSLLLASCTAASEPASQDITDGVCSGYGDPDCPTREPDDADSELRELREDMADLEAEQERLKCDEEQEAYDRIERPTPGQVLGWVAQGCR